MSTTQALTAAQIKQRNWYKENRDFQIERVQRRAEELRPASGKYIYGIWSEDHGRYVYIGETTTALRIRVANHKYRAFKLGSDSKLCNAIREHGWDNFRFVILDEAPSGLRTEEFYISKFNTYHEGYNSTPDGKGYRPKKN